MGIKVQIVAHEIVITEKVRDYVTKKSSKLDRFLGEIQDARIDLTYAKSARNMDDRMVAQITVHGVRSMFRTEERADDILAAFDNAIDKLQRQIERYKGRKHLGRGDGRSAAEVVTTLPEVELEDETPHIARHKQIKITPMKEADALEQMRMLGHDNFFIFFNVESNTTAVIYHRRDGTYGVIETK